MNDKQRQNTLLIKQALEAKIEKGEPDSVLDICVLPCGTFGCVAGDTAILMGRLPTNPDWDDMSYFHELSWEAKKLDIAFSHLFGFSSSFGKRASKDVFGMSDAGTLQQRLDYVNEILEANA